MNSKGRFFDEIARKKTLDQVLPRKFQDLFLAATVLQITNVAEYWYHNESFPHGYKDFPNITPSFDIAFFEWDNIWAEFGTPRAGALFLSFDITTVSEKYAPPLEEFSPTPRFISVYVCFRKSGDGKIESLPIVFQVLASEEGRLCLPTDATKETFYVTAGYVNLWGEDITQKLKKELNVDPQRRRWIDDGIRWATPCLLAQSFLHCKNVQRLDHAPNKKISAQYRHFTGRPLTRYSTIIIDPMKQVLRTEGQSESLGLKRALHITRGHFANYTEGQGLFGKYHGQYWIPQHVKGSATRGVVEKDYAVKAPHDEAIRP